jgi:hypothetical protein
MPTPCYRIRSRRLGTCTQRITWQTQEYLRNAQKFAMQHEDNWGVCVYIYRPWTSLFLWDVFLWRLRKNSKLPITTTNRPASMPIEIPTINFKCIFFLASLCSPGLCS